jgi:hypothetical protein
MSEKSDRRSFIRTANGWSRCRLDSPYVVLRHRREYPGANDRIVAGFIGTGRMGESNLSGLHQTGQLPGGSRVRRPTAPESGEVRGPRTRSGKAHRLPPSPRSQRD